MPIPVSMMSICNWSLLHRACMVIVPCWVNLPWLRKLQQLKGSARAIKELFEIFGFVMDVSNLWYSKDGSRFIAPNEPLPEEFDDQEITTQNVCHAEPVLSAYNTPGFGHLDVPLLFRALGNITVDGWLVEEGSAADLALQEAVNATAVDLESFNTDRCALTIQGFQSSTTLQNMIPTTGVKLKLAQECH